MEKSSPEERIAVPEEAPTLERRPYEPPRIEKKRSIHRVTLLSGMGVMSMGVISMTN